MYDQYQPVTLFRITDTVYVRPRVSTPGGASSRFYEVYEAADSRTHFGVHAGHFEECWNDARFNPFVMNP